MLAPEKENNVAALTNPPTTLRDKVFPAPTPEGTFARTAELLTHSVAVVELSPMEARGVESNPPKAEPKMVIDTPPVTGDEVLFTEEIIGPVRIRKPI